MSPIDQSSRHLAGRLPGVDDPWICPRCGAENATPLPQGCQACGSGKPGMKAPETPKPARMPQEALSVRQETRAAAPGSLDDLQAFHAWMARRTFPEHVAPPTLQEVWMAALEYARFAARGAEAELREAPTPDTFTAEQRTLIAALELFIDQVLQHAEDEISSGEWLTVEQARQLIARIKEGV